MEVVLGQSDEELEEECIEQFDLCSEPVRAGIEEIILYPGYKRSSEHDIALIRLDRDIDVTSRKNFKLFTFVSTVLLIALWRTVNSYQTSSMLF